MEGTSAGNRDVRVGTCGFRRRQSDVCATLDLVEIQQSFYQPPREATAARWRSRAGRGFGFSLKAWQLITHERSSPTYRRLREPLSRDALEKAGAFRWNAVTREAWERTRRLAEILDAEAVVFQTPRRFRPTDENLERLARFFRAIRRDGRRMVFEPRGEAWSDALVADLCRELDLDHGTDPFLRRPVSDGLQYLRLHGRPAYHYRYRYTEEDLRQLLEGIDTARPARVLFNNDAMADDARRFMALLAGDA